MANKNKMRIRCDGRLQALFSRGILPVDGRHSVDWLKRWLTKTKQEYVATALDIVQMQSEQTDDQ
jgi:hypothetical protein